MSEGRSGCTARMSEALKAVQKPALPMTTIACLKDAMVASAKSFTATPKRGSSVSRGPTKTMSKTKSTNSTTRSKSALALERENTAKLPSSPCDMCGAAECLRPWLDDQCHCDACLFGNEKSGRTMSSMRNSGSRSEMSFTPKCMKEKFQKSRTSETSCGGCSSATLPNAGLEMLPHEKGNQTGESPKTPIQVTLVAPWEHSKSQATIKSGSSPTVTVSSRIQRGRSTSRGSRRNPSVESTPALPRPHCEMCGAAECLRPWLDDRCHCNTCLGLEEKECDSPRMKARRKSNPSCESFYASKCMKHEFEQRLNKIRSRQPTKFVMKQFSKSTASEDETNLNTLPALERRSSAGDPKKQETAQNTIRRTSLQSLSRVSTGARSHRSKSSRANPSVESIPALPRPHCEMCGAAECLRPWLDDRCHCNACLGLDKKECDSPRMKARRKSNPSCESFYASKCMKHEFELQTPVKSRQPMTTVEKKPSEARVKEEYILEKPSDMESLQTTQATLKSTSKRSRTSSRGRSLTRSRPDIESTPVLPRPHCEMCGAAECLRPWLDDRCHCDACLGLSVRRECESPRMRARRSSNPSCESFFASKCLKEKFESEPVGSLATKQRTLSRGGSRGFKTLPSVEKTIGEEPELSATLGPQKASSKQLEKQHTTLQEMKIQRSGSRVNPVAKVESKGDVSTGTVPLSRARTSTARRTPELLLRPHCETCGANECLRPKLDERCHCAACIGLKDSECESPRMKARIANKPSCQSFYASKFLKHPAGSTKSKVPARRNSGESNRGNNITTLEDECCSPRHSPSSRLNASSTIKPMLLPILSKSRGRRDTVGDAQMPKKLKTNGEVTLEA